MGDLCYPWTLFPLPTAHNGFRGFLFGLTQEV